MEYTPTGLTVSRGVASSPQVHQRAVHGHQDRSFSITVLLLTVGRNIRVGAPGRGLNFETSLVDLNTIINVASTFDDFFIVRVSINN